MQELYCDGIITTTRFLLLKFASFQVASTCFGGQGVYNLLQLPETFQQTWSGLENMRGFDFMGAAIANYGIMLNLQTDSPRRWHKSS
jgi:hypothetical protein